MPENLQLGQHSPGSLRVQGFLILILLAGCRHQAPVNGLPENSLPSSTRIALERAETWELLSLDPDDSQKFPDGFHDFRILGKMKIADAAIRKQLLASLIDGMAHTDGTAAACFWPRHGIHVKHEGIQHDLLICFECRHVRIHVDDGEPQYLSVTNSPEPVFTRTLRKAGVPLPNPPK